MKRLERRSRMLRQGALLLGAAAIAAAVGMRGSPANSESAEEPIVILNIADLHVTDGGSMEEFKQVISFANEAIHPQLTYIAGDTPDGGTLEQYQAFRRVMATIQGPVYHVAGDHEAKNGGMANYRKLLGEPTYSFDLGRYHVIALNSAEIDDGQLAWARQDLAAAKRKNLLSLMLIHHNFAGIKEPGFEQKLETLVKDMGVKLVLAGHTHNNTVINDGRSLQITTTSLKTPRGSDPQGYAIVTLDQGRIAWHFVPLGRQPVVAILSPISDLMTTGPEGIARGMVELRVRAFDRAPIRGVTATIDQGSPITLSGGDGNLWTATWDSTTTVDGSHTLIVEATNAEGKKATERIAFVVNQAGTYEPHPASVSDGGPGGKGAGKPKPKKEPVTADQVPAEAMAAIKKAAGQFEITRLEKEFRDGAEVYTGKWLPKEQEREIKVGADGRVLERSETIPPSELPAAVRKAAEEIFPGGQKIECKRKTVLVGKEPGVTYDVKGEDKGQMVPPVKFSPEGTVLKKGPGPKGPKPEPKGEGRKGE